MASVKLFTLCHIADVKIEYSVSLLFSASGTNPTVEYYPTWWRLDDQDMEHNKVTFIPHSTLQGRHFDITSQRWKEWESF